MSVQPQPFIPPAPKVHAKDLSTLQFLRHVVASNVSHVPDYCFDVTFARRRVFGLEGVMVASPEGVRHVLLDNAKNYRRPAAVYRVSRALAGSGLFLSEGDDWRRQRRLLAPSFTPASTDRLLPHFHAAAEYLVHAVADKPKANLSQMFQETALEAVLRGLFSMPDSAERAQLAALARTYVAGAGRPNLFDGFARSEKSFGFAMRKREAFAKLWFGAIDEIVARRKAGPAHTGGLDLLDLVLSIKDADTGETLSATEIRDQCATMFFAGSETTGRMLFWAAYLLANDRDEQSRVREELQSFPADRIEKIDDFQNWPRLRNVLLEALRLYPPAPHVIRESIESDDICGDKVASGSQIWVSAWVMHRHRKYWKNPTAFMPDRFAGKSAPWVQMPAYIPFGAGPRICIGLSFALAEAQIVLGRLLARYTISLADHQPVLPIGRVTLEPSHEPDFILEQAPG